MSRGRLIAIVCYLAIASGCGPVPLVPVTYESEVIARSNVDAFFSVNSGRIIGHSSSSMVYAGGIFVPVSTGPVPRLQFGAEDQSIFIENLKSEMKRLGIIGSVADSASPETLSIAVNFVQSEHFPDFQEYKLTVSMTLNFNDQSVASRYEVLSSDGDSTWEKWNTNASKGKSKAASKLMNLLLMDIQHFILQIEAHESAKTLRT